MHHNKKTTTNLYIIFVKQLCHRNMRLKHTEHCFRFCFFSSLSCVVFSQFESIYGLDMFISFNIRFFVFIRINVCIKKCTTNMQTDKINIKQTTEFVTNYKNNWYASLVFPHLVSQIIHCYFFGFTLHSMYLFQSTSISIPNILIRQYILRNSF